MLTEYDFSSKKGERGKYHQAYERGHTVHIVQEDGSVEVQYFMLEDGAVLPEPDVRKYFPDSGSVNEALRGHQADSERARYFRVANDRQPLHRR